MANENKKFGSVWGWLAFAFLTGILFSAGAAYKFAEGESFLGWIGVLGAAAGAAFGAHKAIKLHNQ